MILAQEPVEANEKRDQNQRIKQRIFGGSMGKISIVFLFTLFYFNQVFAQARGWTEPSEIVNLAITSNGSINVKLNPELTGCEAQSGYNSSFASVMFNHPGVRMIKADLLSAFLLNKKVKFYLSDPKCNITEIML